MTDKNNESGVPDLNFTKETEFFDVEGIPISVGAGVRAPCCAAWDVSPPRTFDPGSARRNGAPISEDRFRRLIASAKAAPEPVFHKELEPIFPYRINF